ncbi:MAG: hypothetical protein MI919_29750 [Holophagales bacterium]|nr:hypothetical protein [Holophagales bacterium]
MPLPTGVRRIEAFAVIAWAAGGWLLASVPAAAEGAGSPSARAMAGEAPLEASASGSVSAGSVSGAERDGEGPGATGATDTPKKALTSAEEHRLQIEILRSSDWNLSDLSRREIMQDLLGRDRCRRLEYARFRFQLSDADPLFDDDLRRATTVRDEMEDAVLSAYTKLARESLEDALGIDELEGWLEAKWDSKARRMGYGVSRDSEGSRAGIRSFRMRLSPRLSEDYLGLKMRMPYTGLRFFDSLSFRVRYDFDTDNAIFQLKFDDDTRFFHFSYEPDTETLGDELKLSFRLFW